jgi:hypothetical protein
MKYQTLEQEIQSLWKSRGMIVETISATFDDKFGYWKIKAKRVEEKP